MSRTGPFLTDPAIRHRARETDPASQEEVLCDLSDNDLAIETLKNHLRISGLSLNGITSYDCESMALTAHLAEAFSLPYPSAQAVNNCRHKFLSKALWRQYGIHCPRARLIDSQEDAVRFHREIGGPCVFKPISGSGSELVFYGESESECRRGYGEIFNGLTHRGGNRLYKIPSGDDARVLGEEFVAGEEFSCDFLVEDGRAEVIRISRKIQEQQSPFGTMLGYVLPAPLPPGLDPTVFCETLHQGARALGLTRAICMLDFLVRDNR